MRYILVLGCETENRMPFGGIVDYNKTPKTSSERSLHDAIGQALSQADPLYFGEATAERDVCDPDLYEKLPFDGKIDTFVCLYVD